MNAAQDKQLLKFGPLQVLHLGSHYIQILFGESTGIRGAKLNYKNLY